MSEINDCDLEKTKDLFELFQTPPEERDAEWMNDFFETVPFASLRGFEPQIQRGPDGFPYLLLSLPEPDADFDAYSVHQAVSYCLKVGCGIALFADPKNMQRPEWVFTFGSLWSYKEFGNFVGDPSDELPDTVADAAPETPSQEGSSASNGASSTASAVAGGNSASPAMSEAQGGGENQNQDQAQGDGEGEGDGQPRQILIGAPSEEFLPVYARTAIGRFLNDTIGLESPRVAIVTDATIKPSRALMFADIQAERFEKKEHFVQLMNALRWFLPATRGLMAGIPQLMEHAVPISNLSTPTP